MFPKPTGTNTIKAALKLVRKVSGRSTVIAFHGSHCPAARSVTPRSPPCLSGRGPGLFGWLWDPACQVTARSTLSPCFRIGQRA